MIFLCESNQREAVNFDQGKDKKKDSVKTSFLLFFFVDPHVFS